MSANQQVMRWQLDVPSGRAQELDAFAEEYGFATRKDLLNTALSLLQWAVAEVKTGRIIASVDEASMRYKQIDLPAFKHAERKQGNSSVVGIKNELERLSKNASPAQQEKVKAAAKAVEDLAVALRTVA